MSKSLSLNTARLRCKINLFAHMTQHLHVDVILID